MVWALSHLSPAKKDELIGILESKTADPSCLARAVELIEDAGAVDHVRAYARELVAKAKGHLCGIEISPEARGVLASMADFFVERAG